MVLVVDIGGDCLHKKYTDEALVNELRRIEKKLGHAPTAAEFEKISDINRGTYQLRFGSWYKSLRAAGFRPRKARKPRFSKTDEMMILDFQRLAEELGHAPSRKECDECSYTYHSTTYRHRFGSWSATIKAAGIEKRDYVGELIRLRNEIGHIPSRDECDQCSYTVHSRTYVTKYGSWRGALRAAGFKIKTDDEEILNALRRLTKELGHFPTFWECNDCGYTPNHRTYLRRFGSWEKMKEIIKN
jgi:hypothetical protein